MKKTRSADFCADPIGVITNFAVITNVVIKRFHCIQCIRTWKMLHNSMSTEDVKER